MFSFGTMLLVPFLIFEWCFDCCVLLVKHIINIVKFMIYYFPFYHLRGRSARDQGAMICECICSIAGRSLFSNRFVRSIQLKYGFQQSIVWAFITSTQQDLSGTTLYIEGIGPCHVYNPFKCVFKRLAFYDPNGYMVICQKVMGNDDHFRPSGKNTVLYVADDWLHHYPVEELLVKVKEVLQCYKHAAFIINMSRVVMLRSNEEAAKLANDLESMVGRSLCMVPNARPVAGQPFTCPQLSALMAFVSF